MKVEYACNVIEFLKDLTKFRAIPRWPKYFYEYNALEQKLTFKAFTSFERPRYVDRHLVTFCQDFKNCRPILQALIRMIPARRSGVPSHLSA
jgi:hypothetical protein